MTDTALECYTKGIKRYRFGIIGWNLDQNNRCTNCGHQLLIIGGLNSAVSEERLLPVIN